MQKYTGYNWTEILVNGKLKCSCGSFKYSLLSEARDYIAFRAQWEKISKSGRLVLMFAICIASVSVNQMIEFLLYYFLCSQLNHLAWQPLYMTCNGI